MDGFIELRTLFGSAVLEVGTFEFGTKVPPEVLTFVKSFEYLFGPSESPFVDWFMTICDPDLRGNA